MSEGRSGRIAAGQGRGVRDLRSTGDGSRLVPIRAIEAVLGHAARGESGARRARGHIFHATPGIEEAGQLCITHYRQR